MSAIELNRSNITVIAGVCHGAIRNWLSGIELADGTAWLDLEPWIRTDYIRAVSYVVDRYTLGEKTTERQLHEEWVEHRKAHGWRYGEKKCVKTRLDPVLLPWEELTEIQKLRDRLFLNIVNTFLE